MSNALEGNSEAYRWEEYGRDGLRSINIAKSNPAWSYNTEPNKSNLIESDEDDNGAYIFSDSSTGQPSARRGNLYNWIAATLGSGLKLEDSGDNAPDSICPYGWQLPVYDKDRSFSKLLNTYSVGNYAAGFNRLAEWPLQYLPTGSYDSSRGYIAYRVTEGNWWSGVADSAEDSYRLYSYTTEVYAQNYNYRGYGFALRCVAGAVIRAQPRYLRRA